MISNPIVCSNPGCSRSAESPEQQEFIFLLEASLVDGNGKLKDSLDGRSIWFNGGRAVLLCNVCMSILSTDWVGE
jgi:hypothetical protein